MPGAAAKSLYPGDKIESSAGGWADLSISLAKFGILELACV
jgi:hypothetical protein